MGSPVGRGVAEEAGRGVGREGGPCGGGGRSVCVGRVGGDRTLSNGVN